MRPHGTQLLSSYSGWVRRCPRATATAPDSRSSNRRTRRPAPRRIRSISATCRSAAEILPLKLTNAGRARARHRERHHQPGRDAARRSSPSRRSTNTNGPSAPACSRGLGHGQHPVSSPPRWRADRDAGHQVEQRGHPRPQRGARGQRHQRSIVGQPRPSTSATSRSAPRARCRSRSPTPGTSPSGLIQVSPVAGTQAAEFSWTGTPDRARPRPVVHAFRSPSPRRSRGRRARSSRTATARPARCRSDSALRHGRRRPAGLRAEPDRLLQRAGGQQRHLAAGDAVQRRDGRGAIKPFAMQSGSTTPFSPAATPALPITLQPLGSFSSA